MWQATKINTMKAYTYLSQGHFELINKPKPELQHARDAIVRVTLSSICTSDLHIKHGSVPRAVPGITVGHEMVGIVEQEGLSTFYLLLIPRVLLMSINVQKIKNGLFVSIFVCRIVGCLFYFDCKST